MSVDQLYSQATCEETLDLPLGTVLRSETTKTNFVYIGKGARGPQAQVSFHFHPEIGSFLRGGTMQYYVSTYVHLHTAAKHFPQLLKHLKPYYRKMWRPDDLRPE